MFLVCPYSRVCCNPIPKKRLFLPGRCVPWCPRVSRGCSEPIKCSGVPFPPDCQPTFSLKSPSPSPTKHCHSIHCAYIRHSGRCHRTTVSPSLPWLPGNELCYLASLYKWMNTAASFCFLKLPLTIVTSFSDNTPVFICSMHIWNAAEAYLQLVLSWVWNKKEMQYNKGILERSEGTGPLMAA